MDTETLSVAKKFTKNKFAELKNLITNIAGFSAIVVQKLPTDNINPKAIYFVPKDGSDTDSHNEYIYADNKWELIGSTVQDLTGYAKINDDVVSETETLSSKKIETTYMKAKLMSLDDYEALGGNSDPNTVYLIKQEE